MTTKTQVVVARSTQTELVPKKVSHSAVWKYFGFKYFGYISTITLNVTIKYSMMKQGTQHCLSPNTDVNHQNLVQQNTIPTKLQQMQGVNSSYHISPRQTYGPNHHCATCRISEDEHSKNGTRCPPATIFQTLRSLTCTIISGQWSRQNCGKSIFVPQRLIYGPVGPGTAIFEPDCSFYNA